MNSRLHFFLVVALSLSQTALAGFDASCTYSAEWLNNDKKVSGVYSDLSGCQASSMGFKTEVNNILLGGKGDAEVIGISAGSDGDGCKGGSNCMSYCEPLCCMTTGCLYASIKKETKTKDYVVYKETTNYYYCRMYSSGSLQCSDTQSTCTKKGSTYCADMALAAFGLNSTEYNQLVAAAAYPSCGKRRSLLAAPATLKKVPTKAQIDAKIQAAFKPFALLKNRAIQLIKTGQLKRTIVSSGVCR